MDSQQPSSHTTQNAPSTGSWLESISLVQRVFGNRSTLQVRLSTSDEPTTIPTPVYPVHESNGELIDNSSLNHGQQPTASSPPPLAALEAAEAGASRWTHQEESADLASEAERLRLTGNQSATLDIRSVAKFLHEGVPYCALFLIIFLYKYFKSIAIIAFGTTMLQRLNTSIKLQVARRGEVQRSKAWAMSGVAALYSVVVGFVGLGTNFPKILTFRGAALGPEFPSVLFTTAIADLSIRLLLTSFKSVVLATSKCGSTAQCRRRACMFGAVDYSGVTYRNLVPVTLWLRYFRNAGLIIPVSLLVCALYLIWKTVNVLEKIALAGLAILQVTGHGSSYGSILTAEELSQVTECAICQEPELRSPVKLVCGHCFCENCIEEWLARENNNCPMCRREIVNQTSNVRARRDGDTSLIPILC